MWSFDRRDILRLLAASTAAAGLGGCGFKPLYANGGSELVGRIELGDVSGRSSYYLRETLRRRLGDGGADSIYRLSVSTDIETESLVLRGDDATTRLSYQAVARFSVVDIKTGERVLDDDVRVISSYDATSSLYSTRTSERAVERQVAETLGERISSRVMAGLSAQNPT